jgi:four helix bundle protein
MDRVVVTRSAEIPMTPRPKFDFENLDVFTSALEAVAAVDQLVAALPDGRGYVRDQLRRAANSIPLNIAEGAGEFAPIEKARFYRMAKRSATECAGQILVARKLALVPDTRVDAALDELHRVVAMLIVMIRRCGERSRDPDMVRDA